MKAFGLDHGKLKEQFADATKKLRAQAEDTLGSFIDTNGVERGVAEPSRARPASVASERELRTDRPSLGDRARVVELEDVIDRQREELRALKDALREISERSLALDEAAETRGEASASASASEIDRARARETSLSEMESMQRKLVCMEEERKTSAEEARAFEREREDAKRRIREAANALESERVAKVALESDLRDVKVRLENAELENAELRASASSAGEPPSTSAALEETLEKLRVERSATAEATADRDRALKQVQSMRGVNETLQKQLMECVKRVPELEHARDEVKRDAEALAESLALARAELERAERGASDAEARAERSNALQLTTARERDALCAELAEMKRVRDNSKQVQSDVEAARQRMSEGALKKSLASAETKANVANELVKTLKAQLEGKESEMGTLIEARDASREESMRLQEQVASLQGAVSERNIAMTKLAELRTELADAKRSLEATSIAGSSISDVERARDKAESDLLVMARRVATLEQRVLEAQRAGEEVIEEIEPSTALVKGDREEIERLRARVAELDLESANAKRSISELAAARAALEDARNLARAQESARAEMTSRLESAEIRLMNANALTAASKIALEDRARLSEESAAAALAALVAERDAAKISADAAEKDRDAWSKKCIEAREMLEAWRLKARKLLAEKDRELDAVRGGASPSLALRRAFSDDENDDDAVDSAPAASTAPISALAPGALDAEHVEYLRAVVKQFLLAPDDARERADALVPVLTTILRFPVEDEFMIKSHRLSQKLKNSRRSMWPLSS